MQKKYPYWLAGRPVLEGEQLPVTDKFSGDVVASVTLAGPDAIESALASGFAARDAMRKVPPYARKQILLHVARRFRERSEELALLLAIEAGKPIKDARGEVTRLVDTFEIAADEALRPGGDVIGLEISERAKGTRGMTQRVPAGLCSFITPFNFPLNLVAHKVAPAIAAGCPFVLKPSDRTPLSSLVLAEVLAETELPEGS